MELMTPTSKLPCNLPMALRRAASAAESGMTSRAMRAHEASCGSDNRGASAGMAFLEP